jgi:predicted aldo/keto reductase-like oxidoreductase
MKRRSFLMGVSGALGTGVLGGQPGSGQETAAQTAAEANGQELPRRVLGRTGAEISVVGFPGLALRHHEQPECTAGIHKAFDQGVNYFDVAPAYGRDGECEIKMGVGLQGLDRSKIYLSCKTRMYDKDKAREELERSLKRLKTDHFDLYQLHCLRRPEEVAQALAPGGAMETILKAQEEGKIKHIGFSAHTTKAALAALDGFPFDTCMFPINFVEYYAIGFGKPVLKLAAEKGAAVISIKPVSRGLWPKDVQRTRQWWYRPVEDEQEMLLAMRFVLSLEGVVTGIPISFLDILDKTIAAARNFKPITEEETEQVRRLAATCESVFLKEEQQVARNLPADLPVYPDSPHECCGRHQYA